MKICHASSLIPDTVIIANIINLLQLHPCTPQNQQHHTNITKSECRLGCCLFIKNALYFTGIESCSWVTEISLKILELMVFVIGKKTPRHTLFGGNPTTATIFVKFSCFIFIQPHELPNYSRIHCPLLQY